MKAVAESSADNHARERWQTDELSRLATADDLHISPLRADGVTYGTPTWIWSVVVDDDLYVRAYHGTRSRWYRAALAQRAGRIRAIGTTHEVAFEPISGSIQSRIDAAYRAKYGGSPYLDAMVGEQACAATVKITPRAE